MSRRIGIGLVGFGFIGKVHTHAYQTLPLFFDPCPVHAELVGVCTSRQETADRAAQIGRYSFGTTDFDQLLARDDIDVIDICTPNHLHLDQILAALEAGKHVYCDKPLTVDLSSAQQIAAAAKQRPNLCHGMAFHCRFVPACMKARQLIADGFLGRLYHYRATYYHAGYTDPARPISWRLQKEFGGGALSDLGSHIIDMMMYLLGDISRVRGSIETFITERPVAPGASETVPVEVDDYVCLEAVMGRGGRGLIEASRFATGTQDGFTFEIYGERGSLKFDMMDPNFLYAYDMRDPEGELGGERGYKQIECVQRYPKPSALPSPKLPVGWMRFHTQSIFDFLHALSENRLGTATLFDGVRTQAVDEAVTRSVDTGDWAEVHYPC
ncbi:MAG: Gfo/Idh/MocA family oxidoreductase [candidate division WS1 bacterium]|nr:Gfo/Idh/MocA family oxidoreductase [candidate division WS1 bacterium]